eukprot:jgi/Tetstr1/449050/TSEL_036265.t1
MSGSNHDNFKTARLAREATAPCTIFAKGTAKDSVPECTWRERHRRLRAPARVTAGGCVAQLGANLFVAVPVDALESAEGGFALGDLWAALDELEEDQLIEEIVKGLLNDVDASNQEGEECDHENAYAYSSSEAGDSGDDEDELYFSPLPTRNPRRDTLYGHAYFVDDAMSDDEMEPRRGKGSNGRLWAGHEKATSEHTFETWKNSTDCAMEKEQQQAFDRNRPFNEIHEVHVLRSRIQPKYLESLETTLISRGIKYEDSRIARRLEGAERLDYYRRLLDGMWEELVNITKQIELHSERYSKCHRSPGETVREFRNLLLTHTRVKNLVTEETTRIVEISRVNVEFIERAWDKTRFSPRIKFAQQQLVDYTMDTQVDRTWEMAEWLDKQERGSIHVRAHSRVQSGGGRRGFDHEEHNSRGGGRGSNSRGRGGSHGEGGNYHRRGGGGGDRGGGRTERSAYARDGDDGGRGSHVNEAGCYGCGSKDHYKSDCPLWSKTCSECGKKGHIAKRCWKANPDLRPETPMAATNPREHIRVREEPKKPDRKSCMMCGKDAGHTTEECGKLRKFVANLQATDGHEPKHPPLNGYAQVVGSEEGEVVGLAAASQLRPQRKSTEAQRHGVNTVRMEDGEREARQRRLPRGFTTPSMEMAQQMHSRTELTAKLTSAAQSVTVPVSLANGGGQPRMPLMEIAKRLVKHEPVEDVWEKHAVMRALESKRVSISLMEAYQLERSGGGMMESVMATAWGGGALSTEPISSHAHSARTSSGERAFEAALMMVEEVADQQSGGESTAEEKTAGGEAETERSFAIYRPGQLARQREEEEDRKRANAQRNASTAVEEASVCRRSGKWEPATDYRRSATEADIREQALRLPKGSETRRCLEQQAEVAHKGIFALQPTGAEAKEQPETARLDTITCELHANNTLLQCETISDGGSSHTRMNASAMEPSAAEAVVKGAGGWVDVDMVVVLANGKRSCEQQRRLRDGVVFTLRDPVTSIMAAHHAPRVYENGGEAPGLLLGGPTITALGLRPDPATRICTFRAPNRPAGRVPLLSQTAWERRVREHQPVVRVERASYCHGVELGDDEMGEESGGGSDVSHSHAAHEPSRRDVQESKTCEPADLPPLREVQSLQRHGLARLSTREEGISLYEPCGGGYVAVLNAMLANGQKVARYRHSDIDPAARKAAGQRVQGAQ